MLLLKHTHVSNAFGSLRTVCADNEVFFCANDIALALGFKDAGSAVRRHCLMPMSFSHSTLSDRSKTRMMNFIDADDVLRLAAHSLKDEQFTDEFVDSLFFDLIPAVRAEYQKAQESTATESDVPEHDDYMNEAAAVLEKLVEAVREQFGDDVVLDAIIFPN